MFTYPMIQDSSSVCPSASKIESVFGRRSPPYVLVYPMGGKKEGVLVTH